MTNKTIAAPEQTSKPADGKSEFNAGLEILSCLRGILASDNPIVRYDHVCEDCKIEFSNVVNISPLCCVCEVKHMRSEW